MSLRSLDNAFKNFFHKNADHPKFRKKGKNDYFAIPQHVMIEKKRIHFPKFKEGIYFKGKAEGNQRDQPDHYNERCRGIFLFHKI